MASKAFRAALVSMKETKSVDTILQGTAGNYLPEGAFDVTITVVDTAKMEDNRLDLTYQSEDGKTHNEAVFLMSYDGSELSWGFKKLLAGVVPDTEALGLLIDRMAEDDNAIAVLTGMKTNIRLEYRDGFTVKTTGSGLYAAFDRKSDAKLTEEFENIDDAKDAARAAGHKPSYLKITKFTATHKEANVDGLRLAFSGKQQPQAAVGGVGSAQSVASAAVAKTI